MKHFFKILLFILFLPAILVCNKCYSKQGDNYFAKGWQELIKDNDTQALKFFRIAYEDAREQNNVEHMALSLLDMGICTYGTSYSNGLEYATAALAQYKKLETLKPQVALEGRLRCLQLISTIYGRQGKNKDAIALSREVIYGFSKLNDTGGYTGLAYSSLGAAYGRMGKTDSALYYHQKALSEWQRTNNYVYLPAAYFNIADIEMQTGNKAASLDLYQHALRIGDSMENRQVQVPAYLGLGKWHFVFDKDRAATLACYLKAYDIAKGLSDKLFYQKVLTSLIDYREQQGEYKQAMEYEQELMSIKDTVNTWEKDRVIKSLEVQFRVQEKDRELSLAQKERKITTLANYILWGTIGFILVISGIAIYLLRRINDRDKQLLQTKETLIEVIEEQRRQQEQLMQNEIEYKESQLSALILQMQQKNELMQELKERIEKDRKTANDNSLNKIINKGINHDREWSDFNTYFESINKNFFTKLKTEYPDISPNDLKICALIKLNMSIKEMAGILNISPDSVKTARYRLRKKLQLETEDNLTEFILSL
ncbi:tetratricopeptide repeat protein [Flavipsychrobacter stenotrophus]|uniref:tetratricopeptide repeat protein n=1 Tax=Flavipsychrobacter stenotrophus TaxID=2077091 RepID=UPI0010572CF2|nr:tetratricopeptide repeat protein [Flavipsychrobacter stenotrophus]